jgi:hypothetical protein
LVRKLSPWRHPAHRRPSYGRRSLLVVNNSPSFRCTAGAPRVCAPAFPLARPSSFFTFPPPRAHLSPSYSMVCARVRVLYSLCVRPLARGGAAASPPVGFATEGGGCVARRRAARLLLLERALCARVLPLLLSCAPASLRRALLVPCRASCRAPLASLPAPALTPCGVASACVLTEAPIFVLCARAPSRRALPSFARPCSRSPRRLPPTSYPPRRVRVKGMVPACRGLARPLPSFLCAYACP